MIKSPIDETNSLGLMKGIKKMAKPSLDERDYIIKIENVKIFSQNAQSEYVCILQKIFHT
jgi:hypothetical protein